MNFNQTAPTTDKLVRLSLMFKRLWNLSSFKNLKCTHSYSENALFLLNYVILVKLPTMSALLIRVACIFDLLEFGNI